MRTLQTPTRKSANRIPNQDDPIGRVKESVSRGKLKRAPSLIRDLRLEELADERGKEEGQLKKGSILKHLDERDGGFTHKYKSIKSHNKCSDFAEVKLIIEELLDKHAHTRALTLSEQYILTGYMGKFIELIKPMKPNVYTSFNIARRLDTNNAPNSNYLLLEPPSPSKRSHSRKSRGKAAPSAADEKRVLMNKELERLRFLWQLYRLKCLVCPELGKIGEYSESEAHHEMLELLGKLKTIQRSREKVGEEKSLQQLQKVMRAFQDTVKKCLC